MSTNTTAPFLPPSIRQVSMRGFWGEWITTVREKTAGIIYRRAIDAGMLEQIDRDFPNPADKGLWGNMYCTMQMFWDSDIGKIIETREKTTRNSSGRRTPSSPCTTNSSSRTAT